MFRKILAISTLTGLLAVAQDKPAAPARKPVSTAAASPIDSVVKLLKSGMSESLILKTVQKQKPYTPTADEMVKLKEAGASDTLIGAIIDPSSASAPAAAAPAKPAPVVAKEAPPSVMPTAPAATPATPAAADCPVPSGVSAAANSGKRRLSVSPFDYAAVKTNVTAMFGNDMNIGEGIRAMLGVKMAQSKNVVLLEREKIKAVMAEQDFGATNRVKQGSQAKIGKITGADAMLFGDIVIFGRDDKTKKSGAGGAIGGVLGGVWGRAGAAVSNSWTADKAVVAINLRIVDAETGETLDAAEARGESTRTSTNWAGMASGWKYGTGGAGGGAGQSMTSSNFAETIIGEATQDAVNKIAAILDQKVPAIAAKTRTVEGRVATIDGCTLYLSVGGNDGVQVGDHFEIHQIVNEVHDPETKEVIDRQTVKVGDFVVGTVRDKVSIGQYGGQPLNAAALGTPKGYAARLVLK